MEKEEVSSQCGNNLLEWKDEKTNEEREKNGTRSHPNTLPHPRSVAPRECTKRDCIKKEKIYLKKGVGGREKIGCLLIEDVKVRAGSRQLFIESFGLI